MSQFPIDTHVKKKALSQKVRYCPQSNQKLLDAVKCLWEKKYGIFCSCDFVDGKHCIFCMKVIMLIIIIIIIIRPFRFWITKRQNSYL